MEIYLLLLGVKQLSSMRYVPGIAVSILQSSFLVLDREYSGNSGHLHHKCFGIRPSTKTDFPSPVMLPISIPYIS